METKELRDAAHSAAHIAGRFFAIGLEPPGNIEREVALFKRRLFAILGDPSALAFPDSVILAFGARPPGLSPFSGVDRREIARALAQALARVWESVDPAIAFGIGEPEEKGETGKALEEAGSALFLGFHGPIEGLADRARSFFGTIGLSELENQPFASGRGCFLCAKATAAARAAAAMAAPPVAGFRDCALVLWSFAVPREDFRASSWRELARAERPSVNARGSPPRSYRGLRT
ncbi:MAG: hypothetical protein Q8M76_05725 [Spirochaetaceae bacterium]|nr:hypothetical protein [Spirochaetaceae bacterium]